MGWNTCADFFAWLCMSSDQKVPKAEKDQKDKVPDLRKRKACLVCGLPAEPRPFGTSGTYFYPSICDACSGDFDCSMR